MEYQNYPKNKMRALNYESQKPFSGSYSRDNYTSSAPNFSSGGYK